MREIQCPTCRDFVRTKYEKPLVLGIFSGGQHPLIIKCERCTNSFKLLPGDFARMPEVDVVK
ncbi:MAG: hypothetical protein GTO63_15755 [Anaerolineae bacterium]|nr:hypothetical protein [Anaerolineae bacterium]NIN96284.1 hypothetical protein [Anaerolineae bacterium]NIQ79304.1 hypothetical protein [Anaerolineae bacterium]